VVYRGITQTFLLEAFSDLADGLILLFQVIISLKIVYILYVVHILERKYLGFLVYNYCDKEDILSTQGISDNIQW